MTAQTSNQYLTDDVLRHYASEGLPETSAMATELLRIREQRRAGETGCSPPCERLRDCEISLGAFDPGATSEYWLKYGSRAAETSACFVSQDRFENDDGSRDETSVRLYSEKDVAAITAAALAARRAKEITYEQVAEVHSGCLRWTLPFGDPGYEMGNYPLYRRALKANCFTNPDPAASTGASEPQPPLGSSSAAGSDLPDRILKEPQ